MDNITRAILMSKLKQNHGFDPLGAGYDYETAMLSGMAPDETGHWSSREPNSGQILKGMSHETINKTIQGENDAGYKIYQGKDGKYYSFSDEELLQRLNQNQNPDMPIAGRPMSTITGLPVPTDEQNIDKSMEFVAKAKMIGKYLADNATGASTVYEEVPKEYYDTPSIFAEPRQEPLMAEIDAWHGSPHFFDKFKMSNIGTGEGAQAFGHGLYFTDKRGIAETYANKLAKQAGFPDEMRKLLPKSLTSDEAREMWDLGGKMLKNGNLPPDEMARWKELKAVDNKYKKAIDELGPRPTLYKTTLFKGKDPSEYTFLDWYETMPDKIGKRVAEEIRKLTPEQLNGNNPENIAAIFDPQTAYLGKGLEQYGLLSGALNSKKEASLLLKRAGIDGIRYPTESLSGKGTKSDKFNYVIFDENATHIEEVTRY
jgi:hypothetical protein